MTRYRPPSRSDQLDALFACPLIHDIAHDLEGLGRRKRHHPIAMHLAFGAMARLYHSSNRLDAELLSGDTWNQIVDRYNQGAALHQYGVPMHAVTPVLLTDTYRHVRDVLARGDILESLQLAFTEHSVTIAHQLGLLLSEGAGSRTRPPRSRTIYGDGTVVRPLYNKTTQGRHDPDAEDQVRDDGVVYGNDLVAIAARGADPNHRVVLAVGWVHERNREADEAVRLVRMVHDVAGDGIQAVVYDGAFRGIHHELLMSELGLVVVNKVHPAAENDDRRTYRKVALGQRHHDVRGRTCTHTFVAWNGSVHDVTLDDGGKLVLSAPLVRKQVRRFARGHDLGWRFTLGVIVPCPREPFVAWISPHRQPGDQGNGRPDQLRLLPESDPYFQTLYGIRNDSESINSAYKRTLIVDRAAAQGWQRQVLDLMSWGLLTNTLAWWIIK